MRLQILIVLLLSIPLFGQNSITVYFPFNGEIPDDSSIKNIDNWCKENPDAEVQKLFGYCDNVDDDDYNRSLANRRIEGILMILKSKNIEISENVEKNAVGENFKLSSNQEENRKVEIFYSIKNKSSNKRVEEDDVQINMPQAIATLRKDFSKAAKNSIIRIQDIHFYLNSEEVVPRSMPLLDELYNIMLRNPNLRIEIHGHICCNPNPNDTKLSFRRAKFIFTFLIDKGIPLGRLNYKGFGSNVPLYKIPEKNQAEASANRRVEILVKETRRL